MNKNVQKLQGCDLVVGALRINSHRLNRRLKLYRAPDTRCF